MGNNSACAIPIALATTAFSCATDVQCLRVLEAAAALVIASPVLNQGPHNNATPHSDNVNACGALLMPPADVPCILTDAPLGTMTKVTFCPHFVQPGMSNPSADLAAAWTHVSTWF